MSEMQMSNTTMEHDVPRLCPALLDAFPQEVEPGST